MDLSSLKDLRQISNDDDRLVTLTLLIDVLTHLIDDRSNPQYHTLPFEYVQQTFGQHPQAMSSLRLMGFRQVRFFAEGVRRERDVRRSIHLDTE